jgi:GrpB-like predicted nucleotidyltransferase (UPF0157 family)
MPREVKLYPYNQIWVEEFKHIKQNLHNIFGTIAIQIEHFGSTSIDKMPAKPIIDIMVIVKSIKLVDQLAETMQQNQYIPKGENGIPQRRYFIKLAEDGINHVEHIHCYEQDNPRIIDELMFRNYLRINKTAFEYYQKTKFEAEEKFSINPASYTKYKEKCITNIMVDAKRHFCNIVNYEDLIDKK